MNIVLTGMRGTGKTELGQFLAEKLNMKFIDTDKEVEKESNKTISELVSEYGWEYFRNLEKAEAKKVGTFDNYVISTGGGIILDEENIKALKSNGIFVLLTCKPEILVKRIDADPRPSLIKGLSQEEELKKVWEQRKDAYMQTADLTFDTSLETENPEQDMDKRAEDIIQLLKESNLLPITNESNK